LKTHVSAGGGRCVLVVLVHLVVLLLLVADLQKRLMFIGFKSDRDEIRRLGCQAPNANSWLRLGLCRNNRF